jgi:hypothetical protein
MRSPPQLVAALRRSEEACEEACAAWGRYPAVSQAAQCIMLHHGSAGTAVLEEAEAARAEGVAAGGASKRRKGAAASEANGSAAAADGAPNSSAGVKSGAAAAGAATPPSQQLLAGHRQCVAALAWQEEATVVSGSWDHSVSPHASGPHRRRLQCHQYGKSRVSWQSCTG